MFQSIRSQALSKATLGLVVTLFVAAACSHKDIVQDQELDAIEQDGAPTAPVFATEPDGNPFEAEKQQTASTAPIAPAKKAWKKHKSAKSTKTAHKKHGRRHKKAKKIVRNNKINKDALNMGTAMGSTMDVPPPPPPPQAPPLPNFENNNIATMSGVNQETEAGSPWLYVVTGLGVALIAVGIRFRNKIFSKKSRRLVFAK